MTRKCFFAPEVVQGTEGSFDLPPHLSRQLASVLRAKVGQSIELLDGKGSSRACRITGIRSGVVSVRLIGELDRSVFESPLRITLGIGMARPDTMDLVVRQAAEMGVTRLAVFRARRSQYGLEGKQAEKKKERWSKIAAEAICQCGRARALEIEIFEDLERFFASVEGDYGDAGQGLKIFALERGPGAGLVDLRHGSGPGIQRILVLIGPEGGWDSVETASLIGAGFRPVSLGPRTLRLETAAVALISSIQLLWGDMGANTADE
jgi:16S rRNA (uracil1498-N3)-methyltransferase